MATEGIGGPYGSVVTQRRRPDYQREPISLRETIWERGHIEPWEFLQISAWKSANGNLALLSLNEPAAVIEYTKAAVTALAPYRTADVRNFADDEPIWEALKHATDYAMGDTTGLRHLRGVRLPVASAVLTILNPKVWPVTDKWAVAAVYEPPPSLTKQGMFAFYWAYLRRLAELQREHARPENIHELDQLLYSAMKDEGTHPFPRVPFLLA